MFGYGRTTEQLQAKLALAELDNAKLRDELSKALQKQDWIWRRLVRLKDGVSAEIRDLTDRNKRQEGEIAALNVLLEDARHQRDEALKNYAEMSDERDNLRKQLDAQPVSYRQEEVVALRAEVWNLRARNKELTRQRDAMEEKLNAVRGIVGGER